MIFLNIGEPDFTAPPLVQEAAERAIRDGRTQYTHATGPGRAARAHQRLVRQRFGVDVPATPHRGHGRRLGRAAAGLPGADRGRRRDADARPELPLQPALRQRRRGHGGADPHHGRPSASSSAPPRCEAPGAQHTRGVLLASPSNPTGTSIDPDELRRIHDVVRARGGITLVDEIYLGLSYDEALRPHGAGASTTTSSASTASPSTST